MTLPALFGRLRLPVVGAPMFIISHPALVIAQCKAGIVGSFPALNARPAPVLRTWIAEIRAELAAWDAAHPEAPSAPFAVNQIVHKSNNRLEHDLTVCVEERVPLIITSLGAREDVNRSVHGYGGLVLHDITNVAHAEKALERGADGLIAVCAGAGGHAGTLSPFALVQEIRRFFHGPLALSGAIANGRSVLAAQAMGADLAYIGSAFIATHEANAPEGYKDAIVTGTARDIVYTNLFSGVPANYLRSSIVASGLDPDHLPTSDPSAMNFASRDDTGAPIKRWRDIWGCGQGIGAVHEVVPTATLVARLEREYREAREALR